MICMCPLFDLNPEADDDEMCECGHVLDEHADGGECQGEEVEDDDA